MYTFSSAYSYFTKPYNQRSLLGTLLTKMAENCIKWKITFLFLSILGKNHVLLKICTAVF